MHTLFNGLIKEKFVVLNFAEAFRLHTTSSAVIASKSSTLVISLILTISSPNPAGSLNALLQLSAPSHGSL